MSILKRQRELRKAEKAARKRARRHGLPEEVIPEPTPTLGATALFGGDEESGGDADEDRERDDESRDESREGGVG